MAVKGTVGKAQPGDQKEQQRRAAAKDVASCQHSVERAKRAVAQQTEALKVAEAQLAAAEKRLKALSD